MKTKPTFLAILCMALVPVLAACGDNGQVMGAPTLTANAAASVSTTPATQLNTGMGATAQASLLTPATDVTPLPSAAVTGASPAAGTSETGGTPSSTSGTQTETAQPTGQPSAGTPEYAVNAFYAAYIGYRGDPLAARAYATSPYLSPALVQKVDMMQASAKPGASNDPFVCSQKMPSRVTVDQATTTDSHATTVVHTHYAGSVTTNINVILVQTGGQWKMDSVQCPAAQQ